MVVQNEQATETRSPSRLLLVGRQNARQRRNCVCGELYHSFMSFYVAEGTVCFTYRRNDHKLRGQELRLVGRESRKPAYAFV